MMRKLLLPALLIALACPLMAQKKTGGTTKEITTALEGIEASKPKQKRKLLVFSVTRGFRHASIGTGKIAMQLMGEKTGAFEAVVSDDLANFEPERIKQFDAICFLNTTMEVFSPAKGEMKKMSDMEKKGSG